MLGFKFIFRSSENPRKKNRVQKVKYSYKTIFLKKNKYKNRPKKMKKKYLFHPKEVLVIDEKLGVFQIDHQQVTWN